MAAASAQGSTVWVFDAALEFLMQALDRVRGPDRLSLARREAREGEQPVAGFFQTVSDGAAFQAPFADECLAPGLDLVSRRGVDSCRGSRWKFPRTAARARGRGDCGACARALDRRIGPERRQRLFQAQRAVGDDQLRRRHPRRTRSSCSARQAASLSPPMLLIASSSFWPSARTPSATSSDPRSTSCRPERARLCRRGSARRSAPRRASGRSRRPSRPIPCARSG